MASKTDPTERLGLRLFSQSIHRCICDVVAYQLNIEDAPPFPRAILSASHCTAPAPLRHCYSTTTARHTALDASACSPDFTVRVACYLDGVLRAPCLVPRHAAATWNRLPPRLDVASDAMQHYSVGLASLNQTASTATYSVQIVPGIVLLPRIPNVDTRK